jgi:hypothetical protein
MGMGQRGLVSHAHMPGGGVVGQRGLISHARVRGGGAAGFNITC